MKTKNIEVVTVLVKDIKPAVYNPRTWSDKQTQDLKESIKRFGLVDPLICNSAPERKNVLIGGHFRLHVAKQMKFTEVPVVYVNIPDIEKEKELNLRLNKNTGSFDWKLLTEFDQSFLEDVGFSSEEMDKIFEVDPTPEQFDLKKELDKLNIKEIRVEKDLITELLKILDDVDINELGMRKKLEEEIARFNIFQRSVLGAKEKIKTDQETDIRNYAKYILKEGTTIEKRELLANLRSRIIYKDKGLTLV